MPDQQYKVVFDGQLAEGTDAEQAREKIRVLFSLSEARTEQLFSGQPVVMKSGLSEQGADRYISRLRQAGIVARRIAMKASGTTPPPAAPVTSSVPASPGDIRIAGFQFHGSGREYFGIWIVNILLSIVTLGIYSAWATVRNRQYFYGNTELDGASFQFLAKPITILKGRLIALAALILYSAAFSFFPLLGILLMLAMVAITPWVIVRSLRFFAVNSAYRNVRFDFRGRYLDALKLTLLWPIANVFCLFLLTPLIARKGHQFLVQGSRYGTTPFQWNGKTSAYYRFFGLGLAIIGAFVVSVLVLFAFSSYLAIIFGMAVNLVLIGYFKAGLANLMISHAGLRDHRLTSELDPMRFGWIFLSNNFLTSITLGLYLPWAKVRLARYRAECTSMTIEGDLDHFVAAESRRTSALGQELGEAFDVGFAAI